MDKPSPEAWLVKDLAGKDRVTIEEYMDESEPLFSASTITETIQHFKNYHRDELVGRADRELNDGKESDFSRGFRKALEELEEVFSE